MSRLILLAAVFLAACVGKTADLPQG
ncbi:MAG: hypothetical protein RL472_2229, partial [Pseudomonadota bacterium]